MKGYTVFVGLLVATAWLVQVGGLAVTPALADDPGRFHTSLDGDGPADLLVGVPYEDEGGHDSAGSFHVIYGTVGAGLGATDDRTWDQDDTNVNDTAEDSDAFGRALAVGDFDGDAYADVAVGIPWEDVGVIGSAGAVQILYGTASGLSATGDQWWNQDSAFIEGGAEASDEFGWALAAADFNRDGRTDLAVGVPSEDVNGHPDAGAVNVLFGSSSGLSAANDQIWHQDSTGVLDTAEDNDGFGHALAAGDFDGDGYADLAIGVEGEDYVFGLADDGVVQVLYGSASGLSDVGDDIWSQNSAFVEDTAENGDQFGRALATGDFDGDGYSDLAIGVPYEDVVAAFDAAGAVNVIYGSATGLTATGDQFWHQNSSSVEGTAEIADEFGWSLTTGDFNGDGFADLAVGVPYEDVATPNDGAVNVIYGSVNGLSATAVADQLWDQNSSGVEDSCEGWDEFGHALAAGDFDHDGYADLAVGVPYEDVGANDMGAVNVIYGSASRLTSTGDQLWYQGHNGLEGAAELADRFGFALASSGSQLKMYMPDVTN